LAEGGEILQSSDGGESWDSDFTFYRHHWSSFFETADSSRIFVVGREGEIVEGVSGQAHPQITEARLRRGFDGTLLELKIGWPDGTPQNINGWIVLRGSNDFDHRQGMTKIVLSREIHLKPSDPQVLSFPIDPLEQLGVYPGGRVYLIADLECASHRRKFHLPVLTFDAWSSLRKHWLSGILTVLVVMGVLVTLTIFTFKPIWLLSLYRHLRVYSWAQNKGNPFIVTVMSATFLPLLVTHRRVLQSWVRKHLPTIRAKYSSEQTVVRSGQYATLPLKVQGNQVEAFIEKPEMDQLAKYLTSPRFSWELIGVGGAGKTTLASEIGRKATFPRNQGGLATTPMIPVLVENNTTDLLSDIREKLQSWTGEELETEILIALLKKQCLLVIFDGLSERSEETQDHIRTVHGKWPVNALVITSRKPSGMSGNEGVIFHPQPLDSKTLMYFIGFKLSQGEGDTAFSDLRGQLLLASKVSGLVPTKLEESVVTPLLITLFIEEAERLKLRHLDSVSATIPDVYFRYLRRLNPQDVSVENYLPNEQMQTAVSVLARLALEKDFVPKAFRKSRAMQVLQPNRAEGADPIRRLIANNVIRETPVGLDTSLRFVLDPMAEFLAAWSFADECNQDQARWTKLWNRVISSNAPGFKTALFLVHKAFSKDCHWPDLPAKLAHKLDLGA
jgi:hypothetical protein